MEGSLHIWLVDDDPAGAGRVCAEIVNAGYTVQHVRPAAPEFAESVRGDADVVLLVGKSAISLTARVRAGPDDRVRRRRFRHGGGPGRSAGRGCG